MGGQELELVLVLYQFADIHNFTVELLWILEHAFHDVTSFVLEGTTGIPPPQKKRMACQTLDVPQTMQDSIVLEGFCTQAIELYCNKMLQKDVLIKG